MYSLLVTGDVPGAATYFNPLLQQTIIPCTSGTRPTPSHEGMTIYETDTDKILTHNGTTWVTAAHLGAWTAYAPALTSTAGDTTIGNSSLTGFYQQIGQTVNLRIRLVVGSTFTDGTGVYRMSLPVAAKVDQVIPGVYHDQSASQLYTLMMRITTTATTGDNMRIAVAGNAAAWGATIPAAPDTNDTAIFTGTYEAN